MRNDRDAPDDAACCKIVVGEGGLDVAGHDVPHLDSPVAASRREEAQARNERDTHNSTGAVVRSSDASHALARSGPPQLDASIFAARSNEVARDVSESNDPLCMSRECA